MVTLSCKNIFRVTKKRCFEETVFASHDLIFTDVTGARLIKSMGSQLFSRIKCRLRVIDSFGTSKFFNHPSIAERSGYVNPWGRLGLPSLKQFMTFYPHSVDNSHAGFVVYPPVVINNNIERKNWALIYSKKASFLKGHEEFLKIVSEKFDLHATIADLADETAGGLIMIGSNMIYNHGWLATNEYSNLMMSAKVMIGLGFPYEGPSPLEAIANGMIFLNPLFPTPRGRTVNDKRSIKGDILIGSNFFLEKPTFRALSSQVPYIEQLTDQVTVNYSNDEEVRKALLTIATNENSVGSIPNEFTGEAMMKRMEQTLLITDYCLTKLHKSFLDIAPKLTLSTNHSSDCIQTCEEADLICGTEQFMQINNEEYLTTNTGNQKNII